MRTTEEKRERLKHIGPRPPHSQMSGSVSSAMSTQCPWRISTRTVHWTSSQISMGEQRNLISNPDQPTAATPTSAATDTLTPATPHTYTHSPSANQHTHTEGAFQSVRLCVYNSKATETAVSLTLLTKKKVSTGGHISGWPNTQRGRGWALKSSVPFIHPTHTHTTTTQRPFSIIRQLACSKGKLRALST